jgi:hypothetical protein
VHQMLSFRISLPRFNKIFLLCGRVSFSNFVMLAQGGYHLENDLGKFCHMYYYGSRKESKSFYMFGYLLELIIKLWRLVKKNFEIWRIWAIFFIEKSFLYERNHIFQAEIWRKFASERNAALRIPLKKGVGVKGFPNTYFRDFLNDT